VIDLVFFTETVEKNTPVPLPFALGLGGGLGKEAF
jgi:hypothetical protein